MTVCRTKDTWLVRPSHAELIHLAINQADKTAFPPNELASANIFYRARHDALILLRNAEGGSAVGRVE